MPLVDLSDEEHGAVVKAAPKVLGTDLFHSPRLDPLQSALAPALARPTLSLLTQWHCAVRSNSLLAFPVKRGSFPAGVVEAGSPIRAGEKVARGGCDERSKRATRKAAQHD
jgi:hypothetical protein